MKIIKFQIDGISLISDNRRHTRSNWGTIMSTTSYRKYKEDLIIFFRSQLPIGWETIQGAFGVRIKVWTYKDQSNLIKAILDALEGAGVIKNDRYCDRLYMIKEAQKKNEPEKIKIEVIDREGE